MTISWKPLLASLAILILLASAVSALPTFGSNCTGCHSRTAGAFSFLQNGVALPSNLLQIPKGQTRAMTINITSTGGGNEALSLTGLNAAGLGATPDASWAAHSGTPNWWTLGPFSGTLPLPKSLSLTIPAGAALGTYPINVILAGGNEDWSKTGSFNVQIGVPGDYNGNGKVDAADYVLWRNGGPLQFEVDTPGTVNAADYTAWRARFGNTSGSGAAFEITAVPEATTCVLTMLGLLEISLFRRKRR